MAILYVLEVNDPNEVGAYPPSVLASEWHTRFAQWFQNHSGNPIKWSGPYVLFNTEAELDDFLNEFRLTDATLLADVDLWKSSHSISYTNRFYDLSSAGISKTGILP